MESKWSARTWLFGNIVTEWESVLLAATIAACNEGELLVIKREMIARLSGVELNNLLEFIAYVREKYA